MTLLEIPPITNKLGRYWEQPSVDDILVDEHCAVMSAATCRKLLNYECSIPSGTYAGKMWRCRRWLCWYSDIPGVTHCVDLIRQATEKPPASNQADQRRNKDARPLTVFHG